MMRDLTSMIGGGVMVTAWVFGVAIALSKGFWMTVLAICVPPAAWVMVAQRVLEGCL